MLDENVLKLVENVMTMMHSPPSEVISVEDPNKNISAKITLKSNASMNLELSIKIKDKEVPIKTEDFPIFVYHNSIARLIPVVNQLRYLTKNPQFASPDLIMTLAGTVSNILLMLGENSLIRSEVYISRLLPPQLHNDYIIACSPLGEFFVLTVHNVKLIGETTNKNENVTLWRQYAPGTRLIHDKNEYQVIDSCVMKHKYKPQIQLINLIKSLQMQLCSIATMLQIEAEEEEDQ